MSSYPISRNALASGSPKEPWASAHRLMAVGKFLMDAHLTLVDYDEPKRSGTLAGTNSLDLTFERCDFLLQSLHLGRVVKLLLRTGELLPQMRQLLVRYIQLFLLLLVESHRRLYCYQGGVVAG